MTENNSKNVTTLVQAWICSDERLTEDQKFEELAKPELSHDSTKGQGSSKTNENENEYFDETFEAFLEEYSRTRDASIIIAVHKLLHTPMLALNKEFEPAFRVQHETITVMKEHLQFFASQLMKSIEALQRDVVSARHVTNGDVWQKCIHRLDQVTMIPSDALPHLYAAIGERLAFQEKSIEPLMAKIKILSEVVFDIFDTYIQRSQGSDFHWEGIELSPPPEGFKAAYRNWCATKSKSKSRKTNENGRGNDSRASKSSKGPELDSD
ncbi:uncharacterized protein PAC_13925 [Phialocephala subalpina]|uniref:Uncharacterized protein n=1 Tax=Phialocephala subalpina TaxID=576137 RepID=A0A1L7XG96_9HELO|nr:uncharacterized protein PAC_13925 [Phialocephala subalpina]